MLLFNSTLGDYGRSFCLKLFIRAYAACPRRRGPPRRSPVIPGHRVVESDQAVPCFGSSLGAWPRCEVVGNSQILGVGVSLPFNQLAQLWAGDRCQMRHRRWLVGTRPTCNVAEAHHNRPQPHRSPQRCPRILVVRDHHGRAAGAALVAAGVLAATALGRPPRRFPPKKPRFSLSFCAGPTGYSTAAGADSLWLAQRRGGLISAKEPEASNARSEISSHTPTPGLPVRDEVTP
jgi:hypothetical protein